MRTWVKRIAIVLGITVLLGMALSLFAGKKASPIRYGVTFSYPYAQALGLNWREVYEKMFTELGVGLVRVPAYWNAVESQEHTYSFEALDFQLDTAAQHNATVILAVGRRLPRWPECHEPSWLSEKDASVARNAQLSFVESVVRRYQNHPALEMWQVENEPFLASFGECPTPDVQLLDDEIALVKKLDPVHKVLITDSGELSSWLSAGKRGDLFGTTLYRYVFSDVFNRYWINYIPYWFYRVKAGYLRLLYGRRDIMIAELQAEPWTTKGITQTPIDEQFKTMSPEKFKKMLSVAKATGFSPQILWGVEWWYWMRGQGHEEFWNEAKQLFTNH